MPSPFPGMDPWLERPAVFPALHNNLLTFLHVALARGLPAGYTASTANRVWVDFAARREPDVGVFGPDRPADPAGGVATLAAGLLTIEEFLQTNDPVEEPYLEIRSDDDDRLVTAIEVVSPSNKKPGEAGRTSYRNKQMEFKLSGVNLVEIDLLRGGPHTTAVPERELRARAGGYDYHACVMVWGEPLVYHVAPIRLADPLPTVPVPLDRGVPMVPLDLQAVFARCHDECDFAKVAKYGTKRPDPPLTPEQQAWADGLLKARPA